MGCGTNTALQDRYGRQISYVRLSLTDRCDMRCRYCMAEQMEFLPRSEILSLEEIARLTGAPPETIKSRLRYAYRRLRAALEDLQ